MVYRRRGRIRWAKHSRFQPYEIFRGNTFAVYWPPVFITYLLAKNSRENVCGILKNRENRGSLAQRIFPRLRYYSDSLSSLFSSFTILRL